MLVHGLYGNLHDRVSAAVVGTMICRGIMMMVGKIKLYNYGEKRGFV